VRSKEDTKQLAEDEIPLVDDFTPTFVYPIFGQEETIFGHKGLSIEVSLASEMTPHSACQLRRLFNSARQSRLRST
jgi:hypothetical protein